MPIMAADAKSDAYPPTFPEGAERIAEAVGFLKAKGYTPEQAFNGTFNIGKA